MSDSRRWDAKTTRSLCSPSTTNCCTWWSVMRASRFPSLRDSFNSSMNSSSFTLAQRQRQRYFSFFSCFVRLLTSSLSCYVGWGQLRMNQHRVSFEASTVLRPLVNTMIDLGNTQQSYLVCSSSFSFFILFFMYSRTTLFSSPFPTSRSNRLKDSK